MEWRYVFGFRGLQDGIVLVSSTGCTRKRVIFGGGSKLSDGTIRKWSKITDKIIDAKQGNTGFNNNYKAIHIRGRYIYVHRLVAHAFLGGLSGDLEVNHKNFNKHDNRVENLEIVTHSQNQKHIFTGDKSRYQSYWDSRKKRVLRSDGVVFDSLTESSKSVNAPQCASIVVAIKRQRKAIDRGLPPVPYKGYIWSYYKEDEDENGDNKLP